MAYYYSVKNLSDNITWYCIQLSLCFIQDTDNLKSWQKKIPKKELLIRKNHFALICYENNQFYKQVQKYLRIICKRTCGRNF